MDAIFECFNDDARDVMIQAVSEASRLNHDYLGTEHILLGLLRDPSSVAFHVLTNLGVDIADARKRASVFEHNNRKLR